MNAKSEINAETSFQHNRNSIEEAVRMGRNISIYLDDETLKWLDQLCKEWGMGRSKAMGFVLMQAKQWAKALVPLLGKEKPKLAKDLRDLLKDSE